MKVWQKALATVAVACGLAAPAHADIVTYTFGGTVMGSPTQFDSLFTAGASGQYVLTLDTSVANACGGAYDGCWSNAITYMSLSVGSTLLGTSTQGDLYVGNDNPYAYAPDIFQPYTTSGFSNTSVLGYKLTSVQGNLWSTTTQPFLSTAIPTTAFSLAPFNYLKGVYAGFAPANCAPDDYSCLYNSSMGQFAMSLDTLVVTLGPASSGNETQVPAPAALALLGLGLLGMRTLRRRAA